MGEQFDLGLIDLLSLDLKLYLWRGEACVVTSFTRLRISSGTCMSTFNTSSAVVSRTAAASVPCLPLTALREKKVKKLANKSFREQDSEVGS